MKQQLTEQIEPLRQELAELRQEEAERKKVEKALRESERKYRTLIESSHEVIFCKDRGGHYHTLNLNAAIGLGGRCIKDVAGKTDYDLLPKEQANALRKTDMQLMEDGGDIEVEEVVRNAEGKDRIYLSHKWPLLDDEGKIDGINCFAMDITERKRVEEALRKAEQDWRVSFNALEDAMLVIDTDYNIENINANGLALLGKSREEVIGRKCYQVISAADSPAEYCPCRQSLKTKKAESLDRYEERFGRYFSIKSSPIFDETGEIIKFIDLRRDITERKRAEEELRIAKEEYHDLYEKAPLGYHTVGPEGRITSMNELELHWLGYTWEELIGKKTIFDIQTQESAKRGRKILQRLTREGGVVDAELEFVRKDGTVMPVLLHVSTLQDHEGKFVRTRSIVTDITERKQAEERIEHLSLALRAIRKVNQLITKEKDREKLLKGACDNFTGTRGYYNAWIALLDESGKLVAHAESGLGKDFLPMVERLKRGQLTTCGQRALKQPEAVVTEDTVSTCTDCPLSSNYAGRSAVTARLEYGGKVYGFLSVSVSRETAIDVEELGLLHEVATDIAFGLYDIELEENRKQAEEALLESEEFSFSLLSNSPNPIVVINPDTSVRYVNPALEELTGFSSSGLAGVKAPYPWWTEETLQKTSEDLKKALHKGTWKIEELFQKKDGQRFWVEITATPVKQNGELKYYIANWVDITERKKAEGELKYQRKYFQALFESSPEAVVSLDMQSRVIDINPAFMKIFGYGQEYRGGKDLLHDILPEDKQEEGRDVIRMAKQGKIVTAESTRKRADGTEIPVSILAAPIILDGKPIGVFSIYRDITEHKKAEEALRESQQNFRNSLNNSPLGIRIVTAEGELLYANQAILDVYGYSSVEELKAMPAKQRYTPESYAEHQERIKKRKLGQPVPFEYEVSIVRKDGEVRHLSVSRREVTWDDKIQFQLLYQDITERKKAEEALRGSEKSYRTLFESKLDGMFVIDAETMRIVLANQAAAEMYGFSSVEEGIGVNPLSFVASEEGERTLKIMVKDMFEKDLQEVNEFQTITKDGKEKWITAVGTRIEYEGKLAGLVSLRDITERKKAEEQLERSFANLAETVSRAMSSRDPYTADHQHRVAELARLVGEKVGLDKYRLEGLYIGALLHDIGKISTPESILSKPGKLTEEEWALVRAHTKQGYEILNGGRFPWPVADMAVHHHERLDGSGYPHGISGDKLSLEVRILGVCDVVEAMSSHRPYRPAKSKEEILGEIKGGRGTKYDADVVDIMLQIIESGEFELGEEGK